MYIPLHFKLIANNMWWCFVTTQYFTNTVFSHILWLLCDKGRHIQDSRQFITIGKPKPKLDDKAIGQNVRQKNRCSIRLGRVRTHGKLNSAVVTESLLKAPGVSVFKKAQVCMIRSVCVCVIDLKCPVWYAYWAKIMHITAAENSQYNTTLSNISWLQRLLYYNRTPTTVFTCKIVKLEIEKLGF